MSNSAQDTQPNGARLTQNERQAAITELILSEGTLRIDQIVSHFGVSRMTIHRDLEVLEQRGILRRTHGSVSALASSLFESNIEFRVRQNLDAKEAIARCALEMIDTGNSIILDDSTTGLALARQLPNLGPVTLITNFQRAINELSTASDVSLIALGGEFLQPVDAFCGAVTLAGLQNLSADIYFLSSPAVYETTCYHQNSDLVLVKQAMLAAARKRVLIADHTKFGKHALHAVTDFDSLDAAIVDDLTPKEYIEALQRSGVEVHVASTRSHPRRSHHPTTK